MHRHRIRRMPANKTTHLRAQPASLHLNSSLIFEPFFIIVSTKSSLLLSFSSRITQLSLGTLPPQFIWNNFIAYFSVHCYGCGKCKHTHTQTHTHTLCMCALCVLSSWFLSHFLLFPLLIFWKTIPLLVFHGTFCFVTLCKHFGSPSSSVWVPPKYFGICDASTCSNIFGNHFFESCLKIRIFPSVYSSKKRFTILKTMANTFGTVPQSLYSHRAREGRERENNNNSSVSILVSQSYFCAFAFGFSCSFIKAKMFFGFWDNIMFIMHTVDDVATF